MKKLMSSRSKWEINKSKQQTILEAVEGEGSMNKRGKIRGRKTSETETMVLTKKMPTVEQDCIYMHCLQNLSSFAHFLEKKNWN